MAPNAPDRPWSLDREVVLSRVLDFPREVVFAAWTDAAHIHEWYGPDGFTCVTHEMDVRVGGRWRFDFIGPDGTRYPSRMDFREIVPPARIVAEYGLDQDVDPDRFQVTLTFDAQSDGKTVLTLRQLHPTKARRDAVIGFGAVTFGYQTLERFVTHLRSRAPVTRGIFSR